MSLNQNLANEQQSQSNPFENPEKREQMAAKLADNPLADTESQLYNQLAHYKDTEASWRQVVSYSLDTTVRDGIKALAEKMVFPVLLSLWK